MVIINNGWLHLSDGTDILKVAVEFIRMKLNDDPTIEHYPSSAGTEGSHLSYSLRTYFWQITAINLLFGTYTERRDFIRYLQAFQVDGFTVKIQRNTGGSFEEFYSGVEEIGAKFTNLNDLEKVAPENGEVYIIASLRLEQG